jgi:hypothetical protein
MIHLSETFKLPFQWAAPDPMFDGIVCQYLIRTYSPFAIKRKPAVETIPVKDCRN